MGGHGPHPGNSPRGSMNDDSTLYVGLDVHKESITIAYAIDGGDVESLGKIGATPTDIDRLCKRLQSKAAQVEVVYEAGPCGYGLYRRLSKQGFDCMVCAPSLIPGKPGERVKTDRRDAIKLVRSPRAGDLSAVYVPSVQDESTGIRLRSFGSTMKMPIMPIAKRILTDGDFSQTPQRLDLMTQGARSLR